MEADEFARSTFRPNPCGHVKLIEVRATYHEWCAAHALEPLTDREIGEALSKMFEEVGLYRRGSGAEAVIIGLGWATSSLPTR
jgi:hypothetical protein